MDLDPDVIRRKVRRGPIKIEMEECSKLGEEIRAFRETHLMSARDFADGAGCPQMMIHNLEHGRQGRSRLAGRIREFMANYG